jgi:ATP-binding cassette subfamily F protein uup
VGALLFVDPRPRLRRTGSRPVSSNSTAGGCLSWPGNYEDYVARKALQLEIEAKANAEFDRKLAQEEVWIRKGVEARRTRNEGRVRALQAMRRERQARRDRAGAAEFAASAKRVNPSRRVFEAQAASVRFGGRTVIRDFTTRIMRGDRVGIVGPNGAGKSTLIKLLLGGTRTGERRR